MKHVNVHHASNMKVYPDLGVAVLAGGGSHRFGEDKARYRFDESGPTLIERSVQVGHLLSDNVVIIGHQSYDDLGLGVEIYPDDVPNRGPLGGIATALQRSTYSRVLVIACNMPCLSIPLLRWMADIESNNDVVIPMTDDGTFQPMHAIYRSSAMPAVDAASARRETARWFPSSHR